MLTLGEVQFGWPRCGAQRHHSCPSVFEVLQRLVQSSCEMPTPHFQPHRVCRSYEYDGTC